MGFRVVVGTALAVLLLCGVGLAAPAAGGPSGERPARDAGGSEEELRVGAAELAELAAVPAESRALFAKVLGRLEGMRDEMEELKAGKARSDARIARLEETEAHEGKEGLGEEKEHAEAEEGGSHVKSSDTLAPTGSASTPVWVRHRKQADARGPAPEPGDDICTADINSSGQVGTADLLLVLASFGAMCDELPVSARVTDAPNVCACTGQLAQMIDSLQGIAEATQGGAGGSPRNQSTGPALEPGDFDGLEGCFDAPVTATGVPADVVVFDPDAPCGAGNSWIHNTNGRASPMIAGAGASTHTYQALSCEPTDVEAYGLQVGRCFATPACGTVVRTWQVSRDGSCPAQRLAADPSREAEAQMQQMFGLLRPEPVQMFRVLIETDEQLAAETAAEAADGSPGMASPLERFEQMEPNHYHATCDGNAIVQCLPQCNTTTHGFELLATIDGSDSTFICNIEHGIFSWMGPASDGGYIGSDVPAFFSSVVSGAAGKFLVAVTRDQSMGTDLTIQPGQDARISGDRELASAPTWGSGGFTLGESSSLSLSFMQIDTVIQIGPGSLALSLDNCVLTFTEALMLGTETATFISAVAFTGVVVVLEGTSLAVAGASLTFLDLAVDPARQPLTTASDDGSVEYLSDRLADLYPWQRMCPQSGTTSDAAEESWSQERHQCPDMFVFGNLTAESSRLNGSLAITGSVSLNGCTLDASASLMMTTGGGSLSLTSMIVPGQVLAAAQRQLTGVGTTLRVESVTVPELPGWGAQTGMVIVRADGSKADEPLGSWPGGFFVTSGASGIGQNPGDARGVRCLSSDRAVEGTPASCEGWIDTPPCTVSSNGRCVGRPDGYHRLEECSIAVVGGGGVLGRCPVFDTEVMDFIRLPSAPWSSYRNAWYNSDCPQGIALAPGDTISWTSDRLYQGSSGPQSPNYPAGMSIRFPHDLGANGCVAKGTCGAPFSLGGAAGGGWELCFV
jgi:hypothetical protein